MKNLKAYTPLQGYKYGCSSWKCFPFKSMHNRLGHKSVKQMKMLVVKRVLESLKFSDRSICKSCIICKQKQVSLTKAIRQPKKLCMDHLELLVDQNSTSPLLNLYVISLSSYVISYSGSKFYVSLIELVCDIIKLVRDIL